MLWAVQSEQTHRNLAPFQELNSCSLQSGLNTIWSWSSLAGQAIQTNTGSGILARGSFNAVASALFKPFCFLLHFKNQEI